MTSPSQPEPNANILTTFAGLIGVLSIFIYFLGWIYRWAYFGFFQLELNTLSLPQESFLIVPIQVILGNFLIFLRSILALLLTILLIKTTLWLISPQPTTQSHTIPSKLNIITQKLYEFPLFKLLRSLAQLIPQSLRYEMIIVAWIFTALFWLGRYQGTADAFRDAVNDTSTRPIVTLVSPSDKLALGRNLDDLLINPTLKGSRIIGDVEQFKKIFGRETNDTTNPKQPIIWRSLIENQNWVYLFPAMSPGAKPNQRPPVLAVNTGDGRVQLLILSRPKI
ncbi:MAG: hypothetical protein RMX63_03925 [Aulosira sp. ZfuCHP01]|nr:hypothetical protein [Aulosira sp. ZfuVER01]MDZ7996970.1 hypothetical protein [Aulosira sp. DedVER01a]MDZ8050590.1 hypothetical protein [Aulosira sp. ZfuCHP01]